MDIVVTTPRSDSARAAQEAADVIADGGGYYFRKLGKHRPKNLQIGDRCYYVENGAVRGYAVVTHITPSPGEVCMTSGEAYSAGWYVFCDAATWRWIVPIEMQGFQGWRYAKFGREAVAEIGGWLDPRPVEERR